MESVPLQIKSLILLAGFAFSISCKTAITSASFVCYTAKQEPIDLLASETATFIIFSNNNSCLQCFEEVNTLYNNITKTKPLELIVVARVGINGKSKIEHRETLKKYIKSFKILYDYQSVADPYPPNEVSEGLFGMHKIIKTPSILIIKEKTATPEYMLIRYEDLFDDNLSINSNAKEDIEIFLL